MFHSTLTFDLNNVLLNVEININGLYAQLRYFPNFSQLLVSCLPLLGKID